MVSRVRREAVVLILSCESASDPAAPLLLVDGQPLVRHAIRAACEVPTASRIVLWTDRDDEAREAKDFTVVQFPWGPLGDGLPPASLVRRALEQAGPVREDLLVVLPTRTPLRPPGCVQAALEAFRRGVAETLLVLAEAKGNLGRLRNGDFVLFRSDLMQRQDLDPMYADGGSIYVTATAGFYERESLLGKRCVGLIADELAGYEVKDALDARIAERLLCAKGWS